MELGVVLPTFPQEPAPVWSALPSWAEAAEGAGADALWACDHLFWPGPNLECFVALSLAAARTRHCRLGTAVLQLPLRSATAVAKAAASLQIVTGGRFVLGVGVGTHQGEYEVAGVDFSRRGRALDRGLEELHECWSAGQGAYSQLPVPEPVPVWLGGSSDAALSRAARAGDGWIPLFLSPEQLSEGYARLDQQARSLGRSVTHAVMAFVTVGPAERGLAWMSSLYGLAPERFQKHLIAGDAKECADRLHLFEKAGADHVAVFIPGDDALAQFESLRSEL